MDATREKHAKRWEREVVDERQDIVKEKHESYLADYEASLRGNVRRAFEARLDLEYRARIKEEAERELLGKVSSWQRYLPIGLRSLRISSRSCQYFGSTLEVERLFNEGESC